MALPINITDLLLINAFNPIYEGCSATVIPNGTKELSERQKHLLQ